jgi:diadenylate cyclase
VETLIDYLHRVGMIPVWVLAIELFLIGLVVYWAVDFLEGTRGERLFRGVIFILIVGFIVLKLIIERFPLLLRLQYVYNYFLIFVLVIAVAGFQPEIRRALIRIGQPRFLLGASQKLAKTTDEIITAVTQLSAVLTGAIIVIEKRVALGEFIETGVRLEARVTAELLKTIFHPGSALHDMAVIVREDRIVAARVQLPLAEVGGDPDGELGSRHRAAIGITTGSDALCIVISEETGTISLAQDGKLQRNIHPTQLRKYLTGTTQHPAPAQLVGALGWFRRHRKKAT